MDLLFGETKMKKGFTLIELLLYIGILSFIMGSLVPATWGYLGSRVKINSTSEIYSQARDLSERIKYEIRNSSGINSVSSSSISLSNSDGAKNPTILDVSGQYLRITVGAGSPVNLNSSDSTISGLVFTNYTSGDNKSKNIQFEFTLSSNFNSARQEYKASRSMRGAAEVRSN